MVTDDVPDGSTARRPSRTAVRASRTEDPATVTPQTAVNTTSDSSSPGGSTERTASPTAAVTPATASAGITVSASARPRTPVTRCSRISRATQ